MKQMYMLFFGLLVLILAGCSDHDWVDTNTDKPVKVTAQIAKSRVGFNEVDNITNAYWQEGDAITLFTSSQGNLNYVAGASAGSSSSKAFTPRSGYLKAIDGEQVLACYPASTIEDGKVSLPITTDWEDNDPLPFAYAVSSIEDSEVNLQFEHVFSFLKLTVTPSMLSDTTKAVRQLIVRTSSGDPLSIGQGSTFDYSTKKASIANGENTIQIATDTKVVRTSWEVYLPVLPQPADADITITLADEAGEILFELTKKTPSTGLEKGNVYRVGTSISYDTSFLIDGPTFNTRIKQLANDADITYTDADSLIRKIEFVTDTELMTSLDDCIEVSSSDSPCPIYASFNSAERSLTVFTPAKDIEVVDASGMFGGLEVLETIDFGEFDVNETTTSMEGMFVDCSALTSLDIADWNTCNVTDMGALFCHCRSLSTLDIANWNTGKVTYIGEMFWGCTSLISLDLSKWDVSNVIYIDYMFTECESLTTVNLSNWNLSNISSIEYFFVMCPSLTTVNISGWNIGDNAKMVSFFWECNALTTLEISGWIIGNNIQMTQIFPGCTSLTKVTFSDWNIGDRVRMSSLFPTCISLTEVNILGCEIGNEAFMAFLFNNESLASVKISDFIVGNKAEMTAMFWGCHLLDSVECSNWNIGDEANMSEMFNGCYSLTTASLSDWNTGIGANMSEMFATCSSLTTLNTSNWDISNVVNMSGMFYGCESLQTLDASNWNTGNVTDMSVMFAECEALQTLDVSNWNISNVTDMSQMFRNCNTLTSLNIAKWSFNDNINMDVMFYDCAATSQACRVTSTLDAKEFLLARTETTGMTPSWFIWGDAASDGSSFDTVPKEDW